MTAMSSPIIREFAQRLLVFETASGKSTASLDAMVRVCEKLQRCLSTLAGNEGFRALLGRALTLGRTEVPWLNAVQVDSDGVLVGLREGDPHVNQEETSKGAVVLVANLIGLLVTFIGEGLTLNLVRNVWPDMGEFSKEDKIHEQIG